jgi:acyl transferase domain-containing protein/3-hydroxymyristoyl/3-hydroxydecanoyl-(acyl carrier protein) dehydratase
MRHGRGPESSLPPKQPDCVTFGEPIAIVGLGGVFPGARTLDEFWKIIAAGRDTSRPAPPGRWRLDPAGILHSAAGTPDHVYTDRACFIEGFTLDTAGLTLPPELLAGMDPVVQLLLSAGRDAFASAKTDSLDRNRTGIVLGHIALPTESSSQLCEEMLAPLLERAVFGNAASLPLQTHPLNRYVAGLPAGLLAQALGLGGGTRTLDAACASSLYAIKLACDELHSGRADAMLAGGVSRPDSLYTQMGFAQLRALATTGRCTPFDSAASGLIVGEGAGVVVLKRLSAALRDGDEIHGLIRGIGLSNDLEGNLLSPASEGQLRALRLAYANAGWEPESVEFIECHATGTPVGDAIEFASLCQLWAGRAWKPGQCTLGAVKANVGHLLTGAGAAGLLKVLLSLRHSTLPPIANFSRASDKIPLAQSPFRALSATQPWPRHPDGRPRRAAINGFGFGGINAHILIEEWAGEPKPGSSRRKATPAQSRITNGHVPFHPVAIAIIGLGAHIGPWKNLRTFTARVLGADTQTQPATRPNWRGLAAEPCSQFPGYYVDDLAIPVNRYRIPPRELAELLPQQALMLEVGRDALADASVTTPDPTRTGVFIGLGLDLRTTDFHFRWAMLDRASEWANRLPAGVSERDQADWAARVVEAAGPPLNADRTMGALAGTNASRIAKEFRIGGQSYTVCSEDTSGLSALEIAVRSLQSGELDLALAGGVELTGDLRARLAAAALGTNEIPGEGAVAVVIKRLEDARRDGDRIYAVIRGMGVANRGDAADSVRAATARARSEAGFDNSLPVTSAQAEVGHTGAASGLVNLAKAALALHVEVLPGGDGNAPQHWLRDRADGPRRAATTATSVDGNAVHVVLESWESGTPQQVATNSVRPNKPAEAPAKRDETLFTFSAPDVSSLLDQFASLRQLAVTDRLPLDTLARRWHQHAGNRTPLPPHTLAFIAQDNTQFDRLLAASSNWVRSGRAEPFDHRDRDRLFYTAPENRLRGKLAFVFPGAGNHFSDMGRELGLLFPDVLRAQDRENERLASQMFAAQFWNATAPVTDQRVSICGQVALGAFVSDIARSLGLKPDAAIGYSLGESTSLFALRAWTARDDMLSRVTASTLFTRDLTGEPEALRRAWKVPADQPVTWLAGLVDRPAAQVRAAMIGLAHTYILIVNTPEECVIGGETQQVRALQAKLGCHFFTLDGVSTVHCELLQPVLERYRELHRFPTTPPPGVTFYSGGWGRAYVPDRETAADAIVAQASGTIDFPRVVNAAFEENVRCFIEMGPGASCSRMISKILEGRQHIARSLCVSAKEPLLDVLRVLGQLWAEGVPLNLAPLYSSAEPEPAVAPEGKQVIIPITGTPIVPPPLPPRPSTRVQPAPSASPSTPQPTSSDPGKANTDPFEVDLLAAMTQAQATTLKAHEAYLAFSQGVHKTLSEAVQTQLKLIARADIGEALPALTLGELSRPPAIQPPSGGALPASSPRNRALQPPATVPRALNREQCMEFAIGKIGVALGAMFAGADSFPTRVRLPDEPLMLVDRIVAIEGEPCSMTHGRVLTEHDVHPGAWYLDCGRIPTCIAVEAGQADLFLSGFLGIDFQTKGNSVYRLLDAKVCFHRSLPGPGAVIHYDIRIDHFFRQGDTWLFRFNFESSVNGEPLLTMTEGCAGFFSAEELAGGRGVVRTALQLKPQPGKRPADWEEFVPTAVESFSAEQLDALRAGDFAKCFGPLFATLPITNPVTLPGGRMSLVHRIERLEPTGGRFGLGLIRGEADIHPDDWFLTCHFVDDRVMPGTLMYECCLHTLRVHLLRLGWVAEQRAGVALEPVPGVIGQLKCRGQVLETTRVVTYEIEIKEIGYRPEPYVIADALMYADGKPIVEIGNMSLRYTGVTREELRLVWNASRQPRSSQAGKVQANAPEESAGAAVVASQPHSAGGSPILFGPETIMAFSNGRPSEAFGEPYRVFDERRRIARLPGPPYQFLDRITDIRGCEAFEMVAGGKVAAEYDVPANAWYFHENRQEDMPFAVLLEIALQPCGWLSAYIGSALTSEEDLSYRNLGGTGTQYVPVRRDTGTLTTRIKNTRLSSSAGMIIQWFDFEVRAGVELIYRGDTYFGFFPKTALEKQEGIKGAVLYQPTPLELTRAKSLAYPREVPFAGDLLRMVDEITVWLPDGGPRGLGFIRGTKRVIENEWFFKAHFFEDPVVPGSLGLESFLQLLKFAAVKRWGHAPSLRWEAVAMNAKHEWVYRGQVIPRDKLVTVEAVVTAWDDEQLLLTADGHLSVDGRIIYGMKNFTVAGVSE